MRAACLVLPLLLTPSLAEADGKDVVLADSRNTETKRGTVSGTKGGHLTVDDAIRDLLGHPAFGGFAGLLLPWDGRTHDQAMRLSDIGSLLPYHSHVDPRTVVSALNRMIDDVNSGHAVFFPFYSDGQMKKQPARESTGLFFFRGKPGAPFAVISPGGGFSYVGALHSPLGSLFRRAPHFRRGRRTGRNRTAGFDGKANRGPPKRRDRGRVP